jgi:hypothetical protein
MQGVLQIATFIKFDMTTVRSGPVTPDQSHASYRNCIARESQCTKTLEVKKRQRVLSLFVVLFGEPFVSE